MGNGARPKVSKLAGWLAAAALCGGSVSCRDATQMRLRIHSDVPCSEREEWSGVAVMVGKPGPDLERQAPALVAHSCEPNGDVGTLVVVPSGGKDEEVGVVVVAGVQRNPEECRGATYQGCIVARRALRFVPHDEVVLEIELKQDCLSIGCDAKHTCLQGACVDSEELELPPDIPNVDELPQGGYVRCGDDGVYCATEGAVCCLTVDVELQRSHGDCRKPDLCVSPGIALRCDDNSDCPRTGDNGEVPGVCAVSYTSDGVSHHQPVTISHSECRPALANAIGNSNGVGLALCEDRQSCVDAKFACEDSRISSNLLPGYHWCRLLL